MKKYFIIILGIVLMRIFLPIKPYLECNHLSIITKIEIYCDDSYAITYYETIPMKEDNGIQYHTTKYHVIESSFTNGIHKLEKNKYIYKKKAKIISNCDDSIIQLLKET